MNRSLFMLFFLLISYLLQGQKEFDFDLSGNCSYFGEKIEQKVYGFSSSQEANNIIETILNQVGLHKNFQINAASVPNAAAVIQGSTRFILYSQDFINKVNSSTGSKWSSISILAHEIGHHLNGHTLEHTGSRPPIELEADEFSGFVLYKMGATLDEAQLAMRTIGSDQGSNTHPPKNARLEAIAVGWNKAKEAAGNSGSTTTGGTTAPKVDPVVPKSPSGSRYLARCFFNGDSNQYYVSDTDMIIGFNPFTNQQMVVGQKQPSTDPRFAWIYKTSTVFYGVDANGAIWGQNHFGQMIQVGYVNRL